MSQDIDSGLPKGPKQSVTIKEYLIGNRMEWNVAVWQAQIFTLAFVWGDPMKLQNKSLSKG